MPNLLIATVGTRDLKTDFNNLQRIFPDDDFEINEHTGFPKNLRLTGIRLLEAINKGKIGFDELEFPILETLFNFAKTNNNFHDLWLIVTNQDDPQFRKGDTIEIGKVIAKWVAQNQALKPEKENIFLKEANALVAQFDYQYQYWGQLLENLNDQINEYSTIQLCTQGGIDAVNTSVLLHMIRIGGNKVKTLQILEGNDVVPTTIGKLLQRDENSSLVRRLAERFDYNAIKEQKISKDISWLAEYGHYRAQFNFKEAYKTLLKISELNVAEFVSRARRELLILLGQSDDPGVQLQAQIREVVANMDLCFQRGQYTDFLGRAFRLVEATYSWLSWQKMSGFRFNIYTFEQDMKEFLLKNQNLSTYMNNKNIHWYNPSTRLWQEIFEFYYKNETKPHIMDIILNISPLKDKRNNSILAHGFNGISREDILSDFANKDEKEYQDKIKKLLRYFSPHDDESSPFNKLNHTILKLIDAQ